MSAKVSFFSALKTFTSEIAPTFLEITKEIVTGFSLSYQVVTGVPGSLTPVAPICDLIVKILDIGANVCKKISETLEITLKNIELAEANQNNLAIDNNSDEETDTDDLSYGDLSDDDVNDAFEHLENPKDSGEFPEALKRRRGRGKSSSRCCIIIN